jgi:hypothetical protein
MISATLSVTVAADVLARGSRASTVFAVISACHTSLRIITSKK